MPVTVVNMRTLQTHLDHCAICKNAMENEGDLCSEGERLNKEAMKGGISAFDHIFYRGAGIKPF